MGGFIDQNCPHLIIHCVHTYSTTSPPLHFTTSYATFKLWNKKKYTNLEISNLNFDNNKNYNWSWSKNIGWKWLIRQDITYFDFIDGMTLDKRVRRFRIKIEGWLVAERSLTSLRNTLGGYIWNFLYISNINIIHKVSNFVFWLSLVFFVLRLLYYFIIVIVFFFYLLCNSLHFTLSSCYCLIYVSQFSNCSTNLFKLRVYQNNLFYFLWDRK